MRLDCGVILAGGRGTRLGGHGPKALVALEGATLLDRAIEALAGCCHEIVVVAPADTQLGPVAVRRAYDAEGFEGPLSGLAAGLEACRGRTAAILGVDFPLVTHALLRALSVNLAPGIDAVVTRPQGIPQPLVSVMTVAAAARMRLALESGVRSLRGGLERLAVRWLDDDEIARLPGGAAALLNVNTPADLEAARLALSQRREVAP